MKTVHTTGLLTSLAIFTLSMAGPARALPTMGDFNIAFTQTSFPAASWVGMFSTNVDGDVISFMAEIGSCELALDCLYNTPVFDSMSWDGSAFSDGLVTIFFPQ